VLAALVDSAMDAGASLVNLLAVRWALMPADAEHRFGHGKAEALAALGQSALICASALFLGWQAIARLIRPEPLSELGVGLGVIAFAIAATLVLLAIQRHVIRRTGSMAIRADALHYATDLATNLATVAALLLSQTGWTGWDPLFGLAIGVYILYSASRIGYDAVQVLMDRELPDAERERIESLAYGVTGVAGVHGLRTRSSGGSIIVQLHVGLDDELRLIEAHRIGEAVERAIRIGYPSADVIVHLDPRSLGVDDPR
jgi:ferrous-iron efflux pump FieF